MKNVFFLLAFMLVGTFAFGTTNETPEVVERPDGITVSTVEENEMNEDDALYCHVVVGNVEMSCWLCDCAELAEQARLANLGQ